MKYQQEAIIPLLNIDGPEGAHRTRRGIATWGPLHCGRNLRLTYPSTILLVSHRKADSCYERWIGKASSAHIPGSPLIFAVNTFIREIVHDSGFETLQDKRNLRH